jgi:phenylacetate-CoA ligase
MKEKNATALMATPTYVLSMAEACRNKLGLEAGEDMDIQRILCAGEPGASVPATKKRMEDAWKAKVYDHVGATEIGGWAFECSAQKGLHPNEAFFLVELVDLETGEPIEEEGKPGKIIITALDREAQPCIRFDSKDVSMWGPPCECGRTFRLLDGGIHGRVDHITKVKGVLFSPVSVEEVVRSLPQLGDEYELIVSKKGDADIITLKVEMLPEASSTREDVEQELNRQLRLKTNLAYKIEFHPFGSLPRYQIKAKRFKDLRKDH